MKDRDSLPDHDGETYVSHLDKSRLNSQLRRVFDIVCDEQWHLLEDLARLVGGSEAAVSARLRDLRKEKFGSYRVDRRRVGESHRGLFEYRLVLHKETSTSPEVPVAPAEGAFEVSGGLLRHVNGRGLILYGAGSVLSAVPVGALIRYGGIKYRVTGLEQEQKLTYPPPEPWTVGLILQEANG